jgi:hypothetical protein
MGLVRTVPNGEPDQIRFEDPLVRPVINAAPQCPVVSIWHQQVIRNVERFINAGERLRCAIQSDSSIIQHGVETLADGMTIAEVLQATGVRERQQAMAASLRDFEACRHQLRLSLSAAGIEEGMSIDELGRAFGISR